MLQFGAGTYLLGTPGLAPLSNYSAIVLRQSVNIRGLGKGVTTFKLNTGVQKEQASFTGSISGTTLTVTAATANTIRTTASGHNDQIIGLGFQRHRGFSSRRNLVERSGGVGSYTVNMSFASPVPSSRGLRLAYALSSRCGSGIADDFASTYDNLKLADFTIDMNAQGNQAQNGCGIWGSAFALLIQRGNGISVERVSGINHGGSNTFALRA